MRDSWEAGGKDELDAPATITERQLRSLRRGARASVLAVLLALVSIVAAIWSLVVGPDALAGIPGVERVRLKVLSAIEHTTPAEEVHVRTSAPDSGLAPGSTGAADSVHSTGGGP